MLLHDIMLIIFSVAIVLLLIIRIVVTLKKPKGAPKADMGGCMTIGTREVQEDCYSLIENKAGVQMVLADGMGNAYGGRIASRTAVETFSDMFSSYNAIDNPQYFFRKAFNSANREVLKVLDNGQNGTSSLAVAIVHNNKLFYSVVGNVAICVYRNDDLIPITTGHTINALAQKKFVSGNITRIEALSLLENQRIYNYLGKDGFSDIELFDEPITLIHGDIVILMTDGVYDLLSHNEIEETLIKQISSEDKASEIIEKINLNTQKIKDNASILLLKTGDMII